MSLRTRLIFAFLLLTIVPLSAVTLIWYLSVRTFERAAEREATETAADIGRRMEMVTARVGRRMDRLFDEAVGYRYEGNEQPPDGRWRDGIRARFPSPSINRGISTRLSPAGARCWTRSA